MLAEVRLVDRQVIMERQDDRRDDAMRDIAGVARHCWISSTISMTDTAGQSEYEGIATVMPWALSSRATNE